MEDVVKIGDTVEAKVIEIDNQGRIDLSRKAMLPRTEAKRPKDGSRKPKSENNPNEENND